MNVETMRDVPDAPWYVTATDRFMSGWGRAECRSNRVILPCEDLDEAERVEAYVRSRPEMVYVHVRDTKPRLRSDREVWSLLDRASAGRWYR